VPTRGVVAQTIVAALTAGSFLLACTGSQGATTDAPGSQTDFQEAALADGVVTFAEYERAMLATIECLRDGGVEVTDATPVPGDRLTFEFYSGDDDREAVRAAYQDCYERFAVAIDRAWATANAPTEEELQEARQALAECLRDAGEDVPEQPALEDFVRLQQTAEAFGRCSQAISEEFGIPNFAG
jgi:predicted dehydrogenase